MYVPLGGNRGTRIRHIRHVLITFTLSGLWHGANWTFVFWGLLNGLYYVPLILFGNRVKCSQIAAQGRAFPTLSEIWRMSETFCLVLIGWVLFRSESLHDAVGYLHGMFSSTLFSLPGSRRASMLYVLMLVITEWFQREKEDPLEMRNLPSFVRWFVYMVVTLLVLACYTNERVFIYFQF